MHMKRKDLIVLNYQYEIPTFMQNILYYAGTVFDKIYYVYPVSCADQRLHSQYSKVRFLAIPREKTYQRVIKLPLYFLKKDSWEQLLRAAGNKLPIVKLTEIIAVHNIWADCFVKAVSRMFENGLADKENTVILSAWFSSEAMAGAELKRKYPEVRFVSLAHSFEIDCLRNPYAAYGYNRMKHHYCDHVFFISDVMRDRYCRDVRNIISGRDLDKTSVIHLASRKLYPERLVPGSADGILRLLSCSDVVPVKRIDRIIDFLASWDGRDIEWTHFGNGSLFKEMKKLAAGKLVNKENIRYRFMGEADNAKIHEYYNSNVVDLFINVSGSEGVPTALMECMSYGVPAIAAKVGGNTEIVSERNGFLLSADFNNEELSRVINRYSDMTDKEREELRSAAYTSWKEDYDCSVNTIKLLREICG